MLPISRARDATGGIAVRWRIGCTLVAIGIVQSAVCGLAALPVILLWLQPAEGIPSPGMRASVLGLLLMPSTCCSPSA